MRMPTRAVFVLLLAVLLPPLVPAAQAAPWVAIGPFGGTVRALAVSTRDPRVLYAGTEGGGVYRSANGGRTWQARTEGLARFTVLSLAIDPRDPDTVFAGTERGLFSSVDGGVHWDGPHQPLGCSVGSCNQVVALVIDPARPRTLYAAANDGVYQSTDGGSTWRERSAGLPASPVTALALDPRTPRTLYAGTRLDGVYKSTDAGARWLPANGGFTDENVTAIVVDPRSPRTLYAGTDESSGHNLLKSVDGGATWRLVSSGFRGVRHAVLALVIDPAAPQTLYAGTRSGVFVSNNGARSWAGGKVSGYPVSALAIHPTATSVVWAGTGRTDRPGIGVFRTQDRGVSWTSSRQGLSATDVRSIALAPASSPAPVLYAGTAGLGIFRSPNRGARWAAASQGLLGDSVEALLVDPRNPAVLYAGTNPGLSRSADGGATWTPRAQVAPIPFGIQALAFQPGNPDVLYAGANQGFYKSTDAGVSWRAVLSFVDTFSVAVSPAAPAVVYIAGLSRRDDQNPVRLCRSDDAGETFAFCADLFATRVAADPRDAQVVLAGLDGLHRSTDGGASFTEVAFADHLVAAILFDPFAPGVVYVAAHDRSTLAPVVVRSRDGGATWQPLDSGGLGAAFISTLAVDAAGTLYAGTLEHGILRHAGAR